MVIMMGWHLLVFDDEGDAIGRFGLPELRRLGRGRGVLLLVDIVDCWRQDDLLFLMLGRIMAVGQRAPIAWQLVNAQQSATFRHPREQQIRPSDHLLLSRGLLTAGLLLPYCLLTLNFLKLMQHLRLGLYCASRLLHQTLVMQLLSASAAIVLKLVRQLLLLLTRITNRCDEVIMAILMLLCLFYSGVGVHLATQKVSVVKVEVDLL